MAAFRIFRWSLLVTVVGFVAALLYGGTTGLFVAVVLTILEVSFSFDNAVINAKVLVRMNHFWRMIFLTVGIAIAVFGMRLVFPLLIVGVTASLTPAEAVRLALEKGAADEPGSYSYLLHEAHPTIAAFGGIFLLMIFLDFLFEDREYTWLVWLERPLARVGHLDQLPVMVALGALLAAAELLAGEDSAAVLASGLLGLLVYLAVNSLGDYFAKSDEELGGVATGSEAAGAGGGEVALAAGKAAFSLFLYLEILDASFSFDGVIGAFAITSDPIIIAIGLGVGAMYIRSLTVFLVDRGTLGQYVYLEHGAHWAIGALAVILLLTIEHEVPEAVTGLLGVGFIAASFASSVRRNRTRTSERVGV